MEVRIACEPAPGRPTNEDYALHLGGLVAVFDGVTHPAEIDNGCVHGSAWYVRRLASRLAQAYTDEPKSELTDFLAAAITAVRGDHGGCDLDQPSTPASTACLLKQTEDRIDYLVLGDSPLVLDLGDRIQVVNDERFDTVIREIREAAAGDVGRVQGVTLAKWRYINQPDGYWLAATNPDAAHHAITGTMPTVGPHRVRRAALLTDGASAAVELFGFCEWGGLLDLLTNAGPGEVIRRVRAAEFASMGSATRRRHKRHDDATAALCILEES